MTASNSTDDSGVDVGTLIWELIYIYASAFRGDDIHEKKGPEMRRAMVQQPPSYSLFFGFGQSQVVLLISRKYHPRSKLTNIEKRKSKITNLYTPPYGY